MRFDFATATRILFGAGTLRQAPKAVGEMGSRVLLVTGRSPGRASGLASALEQAGIACAVQTTDGEPTVDGVRAGVETARRERCDAVVAFGGGSAIDAGKAMAALVTNPGDPLDYLEVVGNGQPILHPSAPFIAIPTTAGTGSEVTRNAVLASPQHRVKASLRSPYLIPRLAIIDPEVTLALPASVTAATGLDALTQLIEPYVSSRANAMVDLFALEGIRRVSRSLVRAFEDGGNLQARSDMALASLLGGLSLANAGLGAVHGFAAPIGGMFPAPHGAVCAALLAHVMEANIRALRRRQPAGETLRRYETIAQLVTGAPSASAEAGAEWAAELCERLCVPPLREYGVTAADIPVLVEKAALASSMKANPLPLTSDELSAIVEAAL